MSQKKRETMSLNTLFYSKNTDVVVLHVFDPLVLGAVECNVAGWALKHLIVSLCLRKGVKSLLKQSHSIF